MVYIFLCIIGLSAAKMEGKMAQNNVELAKVLNDFKYRMQALKIENQEMKWRWMDSERRLYAANVKNDELQAKIKAHTMVAAKLLKELNGTKQELEKLRQMLKDKIEESVTTSDDETETEPEIDTSNESSPASVNRSAVLKNIDDASEGNSPTTSRMSNVGEPIGFITKSPRTSFGSRLSVPPARSRSTSLGMIDEASVYKSPVVSTSNGRKSSTFSKVWDTPNGQMIGAASVTPKTPFVDLTNKQNATNTSTKAINTNDRQFKNSSKPSTNNMNESDCIAKHRPARQAAPKDLREPSLLQKLRRNF